MSPLNLRRKLIGRYFADLERRLAEVAEEKDRVEAGCSQLVAEQEKLIVERDQLAAERDSVTAERDNLWLEARRGVYDLTFPPDHLQARVVGASIPHFLWGGEQVALDLERIARECGIDLAEKKSMLDFGCGVARVTRVMAARYPGAKHAGADIDGEAIAWDKEKLGSVARFEAIPHRPPTVFADGELDFVYSISVFTHLPEDMQFEWLEELRRITVPGAHLVLTYHGENHYEHIPADRRGAFKQTGFEYVAFGNTPGLPDFYQVAFHTEAYIREHWGRYFELVKIVPLGISGSQHAVVCRREG